MSFCDYSWTLMHYGQYKQVAMLVTRGALNRFGQVNEFADMEKDDITIESLKYMLTMNG